MGMTIDETIKRFKSNAEYERTHGNLQGCLEFRQLVEWLEQLQKIREIAFPLQFCSTDKLNHEAIMKICEVIEDGNDR